MPKFPTSPNLSSPKGMLVMVAGVFLAIFVLRRIAFAREQLGLTAPA